jgi:hypothetical protein
LTDGIGLLRAIRLHRHLSLWDVEEQSFRLAQEWDNEAYRISAGWLERLEREEHETPLVTIVVLANIYDLSAEQLLLSVSPGSSYGVSNSGLSIPSAARQDGTPDHTTVLRADNGTVTAQFGRGVIGKYDRTLDPMVPPGSIVYIDPKKRTIPTRKSRTHAF